MAKPATLDGYRDQAIVLFRAGNVGLRCANPTYGLLSGQREMVLARAWATASSARSWTASFERCRLRSQIDSTVSQKIA